MLISKLRQLNEKLTGSLIFVRTLLRLPSGILRFLAGGSGVHVGGRTLSPAFQFLQRVLFHRGGHYGLQIASRTVDQIRQEWQDESHLLNESFFINAQVTTISLTPEQGCGRSLRLTKPAYIEAESPIIVLFGYGAHVFDETHSSGCLAKVLAHELHALVITPCLSTAPESKFPRQFSEAQNLLDLIEQKASDWGARSQNLALVGSVDGAAMALRLALSHKFKSQTTLDLKALWLLSPHCDQANRQHTQSLYAKAWPISATDIETLSAHAYGALKKPSDPDLSPIHSDQLSSLPPLLVSTAGFDPLESISLELVKRCEILGLRIIYRRFDNLPLGYEIFGGWAEDAHSALVTGARELKKLIFVREGTD